MQSVLGMAIKEETIDEYNLDVEKIDNSYNGMIEVIKLGAFSRNLDFSIKWNNRNIWGMRYVLIDPKEVEIEYYKMIDNINYCIKRKQKEMLYYYNEMLHYNELVKLQKVQKVSSELRRYEHVKERIEEIRKNIDEEYMDKFTKSKFYNTVVMKALMDQASRILKEEADDIARRSKKKIKELLEKEEKKEKIVETKEPEIIEEEKKTEEHVVEKDGIFKRMLNIFKKENEYKYYKYED